MPLAYPSTLDRPAMDGRSKSRHVLRGGVLEPEPRNCPRELHAKAHAMSRAQFTRATEGLSLSGGASIRPRACSSWASPLVYQHQFLPPETTKATTWVALAQSLSALCFLAHPPLCEDSTVTGPAPVRDGLAPARHDRLGLGRFGKERVHVDGVRHSWTFGRAEDRRSGRDMQGDLVTLLGRTAPAA